ncbi:hypothetical protein MRS44_015550 [Fusarium solani]|uniref:uncharacterized protein n=1 Tax=Fusarium solani TaxID=169388 RepID=UPI0032C49691|nr:hypothetical protein MRS44_015550 [Fusarium solani]
MFAHCAGSWLPDLPSANSDPAGLMFPDNCCFSHLAYFNDMEGNGAKTSPRITDRLALFGVDLVANPLNSTEQNQHLQLKEWFSLFEEEQENISQPVSIDDIIPTPDVSDKNETDGPGQWEKLRREVLARQSTSTRRSLLRSLPIFNAPFIGSEHGHSLTKGNCILNINSPQ